MLGADRHNTAEFMIHLLKGFINVTSAWKGNENKENEKCFWQKTTIKNAQVMYLRQKSQYWYWKGCEGYSRFTSTEFLSLILLVILSFSFCHCSDKRSVRTPVAFPLLGHKSLCYDRLKGVTLDLSLHTSDMFLMLNLSTLTPLLREVFMHRDKTHLNVWQMHWGCLYVTSSINRILNIFHNKMRIMHLELIELYR